MAPTRAEDPQMEGTPPPLSGRRHFQAQTEVYVEDISDVTEFIDTEMQCEPIYDEKLKPPPLTFEKKGETTNGTQLGQFEFPQLDHSFDQSVVNLVDSVIMESLKQLQEEHELEALRQQYENHKFLRNHELELLEKYKLAEAKLAEQKAYLDAHKPWDETLDQIIQMVGFNSIRDIAPAHFIGCAYDKAVYDLVHETVEPYIHEDALQALSRTQTGRELLNAIIEDSVLRREAEYAGKMYFGDPIRKGSLATNSPSRMSMEYEGEWDGEFPEYQGYYDSDANDWFAEKRNSGGSRRSSGAEQRYIYYQDDNQSGGDQQQQATRRQSTASKKSDGNGSGVYEGDDDET